MRNRRALRFVVPGTLALLFSLASRATATAPSGPGDLDPSFGQNGVVLLPDVETWSDRGSGLALQPDGKIVIAAHEVGDPDYETAYAVVRLLPDGSLDQSFGTGGTATVDFGPGSDRASAVALQADGRIVVGGSVSADDPFQFGLTRLTEDGELDTSFGEDGIVIFNDGSSSEEYLHDLVIQKDGRIVAVGNANGLTLDLAAIRLMTDGSLDESFGTNGWLRLDIQGRGDAARSVSVREDGRILVGGYSDSMVVARFWPDGELDTSFGKDGTARTWDGGADEPGAFGLATQPDGRIVAAGVGFTDRSGDDFLVVRHTPEGGPDISFGNRGRTLTDFVPGEGHSYEEAFSLILQADGKVVVAGEGGAPSGFALARYTSRGVLDRGFGEGGRVITQIEGVLTEELHRIVLQPDGKLVAAGDLLAGGMAVVRYLG